MKRFIPLLLLLCCLLSFILTACKDNKEVKTVEWFSQNPEVRQEQLKICMDNPGKLKDDPNCINAQQSALKEAFSGKPSDYKW